MSVAVAYLTVILVWTTTPLGITWSNESLPPSIAAMSRMLLAAIVGWCLLRAMGKRLCWKKYAIQKYLTADIGIFGGMYLTYLAAQSVPSGLISVIFGLSPLMSAILAQYLLKEDAMSFEKWFAGLIAVFGLSYIFGQGLELDSASGLGVTLLLIAVFLFSLSGVLLKKNKYRNDPFEQTVGSLLCAVPFYAVAAFLEVGVFNPVEVVEDASAILAMVSLKSILSVAYLAVVGSLLGFICYFYILTRLSPSQVVLTTLITPVLALVLGMTFNDEQITADIWMGVCAILIGLVIFNWGAEIRRVGHYLFLMLISALSRRHIKVRAHIRSAFKLR